MFPIEFRELLFGSGIELPQCLRNYICLRMETARSCDENRKRLTFRPRQETDLRFVCNTRFGGLSIDGNSYSSLGALAGLDFAWQLARPLRFTQNADLVSDAGGSAVTYIDSNNVSIVATTGLEASITTRLTTRVSYTIDYDSNPPPGAVSTDTLSRFTLVYAF